MKANVFIYVTSYTTVSGGVFGHAELGPFSMRKARSVARRIEDDIATHLAHGGAPFLRYERDGHGDTVAFRPNDVARIDVVDKDRERATYLASRTRAIRDGKALHPEPQPETELAPF